MDRIIIIGGGIAGLSSAIALKHQLPHSNITIIEVEAAHTSKCRAGFGMILMANGVDALHHLKCEALLSDCQEIKKCMIYNCDEDLTHGRKIDRDKKVFGCARHTLLNGLSSHLDESVALVGKGCSHIAMSSDQHYITHLSFTDGTSMSVSKSDLVIACDGCNSILCSTLNPNMKQELSPVFEVVSSAHAPSLANKIGDTFHKITSSSNGIGYGLVATNNKDVVGFIQFDLSKHFLQGGAKEKKALFDLAASMIQDKRQRELFEEFAKIADMENAHIWEPMNSDLPINMHCKNGVLIGDAAHPLLPFTSQGTSMAMVDAVVLAEIMTSHKNSTLDENLKYFVEKRRPVANEFIEGGRKILADFLQKDPKGDNSVSPYCIKSEPVLDDKFSGDISLFTNDKVDFTQLANKAYNYRWATLEKDVIPLTAADSDFPIARPIQIAMKQYISEGYMQYGPAKGLPELREAIGNKYSVSSEQVFITNAAASSMFLVMKHLLNPGDEVIFADPIDFLFERATQNAGGNVRRFKLHPPSNATEHWTFDHKQVEELITKKTRVIAICNPHNPVGRVWNREDLQLLADLAIKYNLLIMSDEVWSDISYVDFVPTLSLSREVAARTYTVTGFSKGFGLAGLRLGCIIAPTSDDIDIISQESLADDTGYGVSTISQVAGIAALNEAGEWQEAFRSHVKEQCMRAVNALNQMPHVHAAMPEGTFVIFANVSYYLKQSGMNEEELVEYLRVNARVALVPGSPKFFGPSAAGHIRLAVATSVGVLEEALKRIARGLDQVLTEKRLSKLP